MRVLIQNKMAMGRDWNRYVVPHSCLPKHIPVSYIYIVFGVLLGVPSSFVGAPNNYCEKVIIPSLIYFLKWNLSLSPRVCASASSSFGSTLLLPASSSFFGRLLLYSLCVFFVPLLLLRWGGCRHCCGGAARKLLRRATIVEEVSASTVEVSTVNLTFFCSSVADDDGNRCRKSLGALRIKWFVKLTVWF